MKTLDQLLEWALDVGITINMFKFDNYYRVKFSYHDRHYAFEHCEFHRVVDRIRLHHDRLKELILS